MCRAPQPLNEDALEILQETKCKRKAEESDERLDQLRVRRGTAACPLAAARDAPVGQPPGNARALCTACCLELCQYRHGLEVRREADL